MKQTWFITDITRVNLTSKIGWVQYLVHKSGSQPIKGMLVCECIKYSIPQKFNLFPFLYILFVRVIRFITNRKYMYVSFVFSSSDCRQIIITVIHWIRMDNISF